MMLYINNKTMCWFDSNPDSFICPNRQAVKTPVLHAGSGGSNPPSDTIVQYKPIAQQKKFPILHKFLQISPSLVNISAMLIIQKYPAESTLTKIT